MLTQANTSEIVVAIATTPTQSCVANPPPKACRHIARAEPLEMQISKMTRYPLMRWNSIALYLMIGTNWKSTRKQAKMIAKR